MNQLPLKVLCKEKCTHYTTACDFLASHRCSRLTTVSPSAGLLRAKPNFTSTLHKRPKEIPTSPEDGGVSAQNPSSLTMLLLLPMRSWQVIHQSSSGQTQRLFLFIADAQHQIQCLANNSNSRNTCWMSEWVSEWTNTLWGTTGEWAFFSALEGG